MALSATTQFEVRYGGSDTAAGGAFDPGQTAGMLTDLASTSGTSATPIVTSASYDFVAGDVGAYVFVGAGTNWTKGWYKITAVDVGSVGDAQLSAAAEGYRAYGGSVNTSAGCGSAASLTGGTWSIDYSQQDAAEVAYTDLACAGAGLTVSSATSPFGAQQVGNALIVTGGDANITAGLYVIASVAAGVATVLGAANISTGAVTTGTGNLGGAFKTPGAAGAYQVAGNPLWIKTYGTTVTTGAASAVQQVADTTGMVANQTLYFRTADAWRVVSSVDSGTQVTLTATVTTTTGEVVDIPYMFSSTSSNVAAGKYATPTATAALPGLVRGYDTVRGDKTGRRPVLQWGVNAAAAALITCNGQRFGRIQNLVMHGNVGQYTVTTTVSSNGWMIEDCKLMNTATYGWTGEARFSNCELTNFAAVLNTTSVSQYFNHCHIHDTVALITPTTGNVEVIDCVVHGLTGAFAVTSNSGQVWVRGSTFYDFSTSKPAFSFTATPTMALFENSHFENCTDYAIKTAAAYDNISIRNCSGYNNTTALYNTAHIQTYNATGIIAPSVSPFVNAATNDFRLNNSATGGKLLQGTALPQTYPGLTWANYPSVGASQLESGSGGGGGYFQPW